MREAAEGEVECIVLAKGRKMVWKGKRNADAASGERENFGRIGNHRRGVEGGEDHFLSRGGRSMRVLLK